MGIGNPEHRVTEAERLGFLKLINRVCDHLWFYDNDPVAGAIMHQIWVGAAEGRAWDITSLAVRLKIPRQTTSRRVRRLEQKGWLRRFPGGKVRYLKPTDAFLESAVPALDELLLHTRAVILDLEKRSK